MKSKKTKMDNNDAFRYETKKEKKKHSPFKDGCYGHGVLFWSLVCFWYLVFSVLMYFSQAMWSSESVLSWPW